MTGELPLKTQKRKHAPAEDVNALCLFLGKRGWTSAREIGLIAPDWSERHIRLIAASSEGQIVSGQAGYKLTLNCTPEEMEHACKWLRSQAKEMTRRSLRIARVFHNAGGHTA